jgi:hypothetical protein
LVLRRQFGACGARKIFVSKLIFEIPAKLIKADAEKALHFGRRFAVLATRPYPHHWLVLNCAKLRCCSCFGLYSENKTSYSSIISLELNNPVLCFYEDSASALTSFAGRFQISD